MENKNLSWQVKEFLVYKRSNGCIYTGGEYHLKRYVAFSGCLSLHESVPSKKTVEAFMYRLLYCCRLRCKEVRTLSCKNINLNKRYIDVMQSKGPKSRRIFISEELADYLDNMTGQSVCYSLRDRHFFLIEMICLMEHRCWRKNSINYGIELSLK